MKSKENTNISGVFRIVHRGPDGNIKGIYDSPNLVTNVGMEYILNAAVAGSDSAQAAITSWFIGLIDDDGSVTLANADTMASHAGWAEATGYAAATRPGWTVEAAVSREVSNSVTVDFSINAAFDLHGVFITSNSTKSGTTGTLLSETALAAPRTVGSGDTLQVTYSLSG